MTHNVFGRVVQVVPALIVFAGTPLVPDLPDGGVQLIRNVAMGYMVLMLTLALTAMFSAANAIYETLPVAKDRPLKGFVQLVQIVVWVLGGVLIVSVLLDRSPLLLLSGLGAMTAILLLIFKDTILSLVASVQLTAQDMVRAGDWIEMPQYGADGDVVDVQLHTVKVQNWDKTIATIPTHRLITDSFKNKEQELTDYNAGLATEVDAQVNRRRLTNVGTFRAYAYNYLKNHPNIRRHDADCSSAWPGARGTAVGDLLLHEYNRMGRLRRHPVGHLRPPAGHRAGIRAAPVAETGGLGFWWRSGFVGDSVG